MINMTLICIGKVKDNYSENEIKEYLKRIKPYINLQIIEIKAVNNYDDLKNLQIEGGLILKEISDSDFVITLEVEGKMLSSTELATYIQNHYTYDKRKIVFIIGSSCGLCQEVRNRSNFKLSFSKMTFPHQLMRIIFLEQLYRAVTINNNIKYHKWKELLWHLI